MKQSFWKKFLSLTLTLVFLCSFAPPSFAAEADPKEEPETETIAGYTLEELVTAFQNGDSEVMEAYLAATAFPDFVEEGQTSPSGPQPRWKSDGGDLNSDTATHSYIAALALLVYVGDMNDLFGLVSGGFGYKISEWTMIESAAGKPDDAAQSKILILADHFYNPETGKSWNVLSPTARTRIEEFYTKAVQIYPTNRAEALDNLGQALHFVQDVCEPHHAANLFGIQHSAFEAYAAKRIQIVADNYSSSHARYYDFALSHSPGELVHQAAVAAKGYAAQANDPSRTNWAWVADTTLVNAVYYSAALLYKFAKEVHMI